MNLKLSFKKSLPYTWYLYVIAILLPAVAFPLTYSFMHRPKAYEKLNIFVSSEVIDNSINKYLEDEFKEKGVKLVDIVSQNYHDSVYLQKLTVVGYSSSDVMIIPESVISSLNLPIVMQEITPEIASNYSFEGCTYYKFEDKNYGIELDSSNPLTSYIKYEEGVKYYAFINGSSQNIGEYSTKQPTTTNAFDFMKFLLGK